MVKTKIVALGDAPLVTGFQLAGLEDTVLVPKKQFQDKLEQFLKTQEFGIIIVNELWLNDIDWRIRKKIDSIAFPVIVAVPDISGKSAGGEEIRLLIKRALGFDLAAKK